MNQRRWFAAAILLLMCAAVAGAREKPRFKLHCQVFRVASLTPRDVHLNESVWMGKPEVWEKIQDSITLFNRATFNFRADTLTINANTLSWNKERLRFDGKDKARGVTEGHIKLIYSADVDLQRGRTGNVFIAAKQPFEYFERREDGLFELREIELPAGLDLEVKPREDTDESILLPNVTIRLRTVTEREPVPGVRLPVGRPVLQTEEFKLSLKVREKEYYWIQLKPQDGDGSLLICLQVQYIR
ncbi:MAG TPA: hypothetical protein VLH60_01155 [Sedimentisphaerales bacterium]|nr:hypothetical protein [Sedimentisphaerales bacterium]